MFMNELYMYPRKIPLNKTLCFSKRKSFAFGALIGNIKVMEAGEKIVNDLSFAPEFQFHYKGNTDTNLTFEDIEFDSYVDKTSDCLRVLKAAIFQSISHQCFGINESFDFYNNPSMPVELGLVSNIDIHVITNLKRLILSNTTTELNNNNFLPYSNYKYCWIGYSIDVSTIIEGTKKKTIDFVLGWHINNCSSIKPKQNKNRVEYVVVNQDNSNYDDQISKLEGEIQEQLGELAKIREITTKEKGDLMQIKNEIDNGNDIIRRIEMNKNKILSKGVVMRQEPKEHLSLYTFKYTVDVNQASKVSSKSSIIDMMIYGDTLTFKKNSFDLDWSSGKPNAVGSNTIQFSVESSKPIRIIPVSRRAKKIGWIQEDNHTFNTLIKGLFGEMLLSTGIVPVERTTNNQGRDENEPFTGYVTTRSLRRSITQEISVYFNESSNRIVENLTEFYRTLWSEDESEFVNIVHNNNGLLQGDILKIPVDITIRYALGGSSDSQAEKVRVVEGTWCMMYNFNVNL